MFPVELSHGLAPVAFLLTASVVIIASLFLIYLYFNIVSRTRLAFYTLIVVLLTVASAWYFFQSFT